MATKNIFTIPDGALEREWYWRAERANGWVDMPENAKCVCGFEFAKFPTARIWYFRRIVDNTISVIPLCGGCDRRNLVEFEVAR